MQGSQTQVGSLPLRELWPVCCLEEERDLGPFCLLRGSCSTPWYTGAMAGEGKWGGGARTDYSVHSPHPRIPSVKRGWEVDFKWKILNCSLGLSCIDVSEDYFHLQLVKGLSFSFFTFFCCCCSVLTCCFIYLFIHILILYSLPNVSLFPLETCLPFLNSFYSSFLVCAILASMFSFRFCVFIPL